MGGLVITAFFSFVGLVVGALLQFFFTKYLENENHQRDLRADAYLDYLRCVSEHSNLGLQKDSAEGRELGARTADAKLKTSLYGSPSVIAAFAKFERLGANINPDDHAFTDIVLAMRQDTLGDSSINQADLEAVLMEYRNAT